jgi:hypothetical protein
MKGIETQQYQILLQQLFSSKNQNAPMKGIETGE